MSGRTSLGSPGLLVNGFAKGPNLVEPASPLRALSMFTIQRVASCEAKIE